MAYGWLIIAGLVILLVIVIYKSQDFVFVFVLMKKYFAVFLIFGLILFIVFSVNNINKNYDTDYRSVSGLLKTVKIYGVWVKDLGVKVVKVTGQVINQDWFSNSTDSTARRPTTRR